MRQSFNIAAAFLSAHLPMATFQGDLRKEAAEQRPTAFIL
jgi:hypothetical protein